MPLRLPLSAAPSGNAGLTPACTTAGNTAFVIGTNMQDLHVSAGTDEMFLEVCNIDASPHQLVGSFHYGAITAPDDLFYQTMAPQSGWQKIVGGDILLAGAGLALGLPGSGDLNKLNFRGFVNRIIGDARKLPLSGAGAYNKNIKLSGTAVGSATTLHTAVAGNAQMDEVYLNLTNTSANPVQVTLCIGGTTSACQMVLTIPGQSGWTQALAGESLNNGLAVSAFAATANVINARGWANRIS
jgi:hypothetical protein